ncbi:hypothetical protein GOBAR_AA30695 [Gossypium barbadense]|uniref:Uncharacterized protein n=1 Tax=Gossypium barbadense TaxID=3634 RepID=A0A2P5WG05_GOSBA|nr:hypothetical protein GOBAR_AA30695 [Gossypium barbadense]
MCGARRDGNGRKIMIKMKRYGDAKVEQCGGCGGVTVVQMMVKGEMWRQSEERDRNKELGNDVAESGGF